MGGGALQRGLAQILIQRGLFSPLALSGCTELAGRCKLTGARVGGGLPGTKRGAGQHGFERRATQTSEACSDGVLPR